MMQRNHPKSREGGLNKGSCQNEGWAATRRPDGGYRFVPRGRLGVPGTPRLSEFIRGLHAPGKASREPPREIPRDAALSDGTRSHRPGCGGRALSFFHRAGNFWGEFVFFITVFFCFLFF